MAAAVVLASSAVLAPGVVRANPVPARIGVEYSELISTTARAGVCPDSARLELFFGSYGLGLLSAGDRALIDANFEVFAPLMLDSQRAGNGLDAELLDYYRRHGDSEDLRAMLMVLRGWLSAEMTECPRYSSWRITGPEPAVREEIAKYRVKAAETLSLWGDHDAVPAIRALAKRDTLTPDLRWYLRCAEARLVDSTAIRFIMPGTDKTVRICRAAEDVSSAALRSGKEVYELSRIEVAQLWDLIGSSTLSQGHFARLPTLWQSDDAKKIRGVRLELRFGDGMVALLTPKAGNRLVSSVNTSIASIKIEAVIRSHPLCAWISERLRTGPQ